MACPYARAHRTDCVRARHGVPLRAGAPHRLCTGTTRRAQGHAKSTEDTRTPEELLNLIEAKGHEVSEALAALRGGLNANK